ncbi:hypothetical protein PRK78_000649 [Emydomyces testavorans]|uniref:Zn(2)-C6 fungal-type domain-containing protein n=1 Tax=Emydomyces testavorans TaxID=2070801 RepID=A0AAF0DBW8_9EURO|nr:hypothetical protein PRK78_000649 [Emydomyces testavorans]
MNINNMDVEKETPIWTDEMIRRWDEYKDLDEYHIRAEASYNEMVQSLAKDLDQRRCFPCISNRTECNEKLPCDTCRAEEMPHVCQYPEHNRTTPLPLWFYRLTEDNQILLDFAKIWKAAATAHLDARLAFMEEFPGAFGDAKATLGHFQRINQIRQDVCAVTSRVMDHLLWRDEAAGDMVTPWDPPVAYDRSTVVDTKLPGQHRFPSMDESPIRRQKRCERWNDPKNKDPPPRDRPSRSNMW